jgi:hypothetical protein
MISVPTSSAASKTPHPGAHLGDSSVFGCRFFGRDEGTDLDFHPTFNPGALS